MNTYNTLFIETINGKEYTISCAMRPCGKLGFYVHKLGDLTQWAKVFGGQERKAHKVNPRMRVKGRKLIDKPFKSISHALVMAHIHSEMNITYC